MESIIELEIAFEASRNPDNAKAMSKYMKDIFPFYGIKTTERKLILKQIWKQNKEEIAASPRLIALQLFDRPQREFHYCAIEILIKELKKKYLKDDIVWIEKILTTNSWWDSVDSIAKNILGEYLLEYPKKIPKVIERFSVSDNGLTEAPSYFSLGISKGQIRSCCFLCALSFQVPMNFLYGKLLAGHYANMAKQTPRQ